MSYGTVLGLLGTVWLLPALVPNVLGIIPAAVCYALLVGDLDLPRGEHQLEDHGPETGKPSLWDYVRNNALLMLTWGGISMLALAIGTTGLLPSHYFPTYEGIAHRLYPALVAFVGLQAVSISVVHTFLLSRVAHPDIGLLRWRSIGLAFGLAIVASIQYRQGEPTGLLIVPSALLYGWAVGYLQTRRTAEDGMPS